MNLNSLLQAVGSAGLFSSRVFLPALLTALLLRFGPAIPVVQHLGLLGHLQRGHPTWFTSNPCLIALAVLTVLEILAQKNSETRRLLLEFDIYLKPAMAILTSLGYMRSADASFIASTVHQAGFAQTIMPLISGVITYRLSVLRKEVAIAVFDHIEGTHLDHLLSWLEDAWVTFGMVLLVLVPILMLIMLGAASGVLFLMRRRLARIEEQSKIACAKCGKPIYPCAIACAACKQTNATPCDVGFLGQSRPLVAAEAENHAYRLVEKRRCPVCAARRPARKPFDACSVCGSAAPTDARFTDAYIDYISRRLPIVLGVCFLMSLVPILGLIAAAVYSRIELVLPFSEYLPLGKRFLLRWGIRLLFLVLIFLQIVPVLGGFVGPLMAYISFVAYRNTYLEYMRAGGDAQQLHGAPHIQAI
jgi:hypothetical protein